MAEHAPAIIWMTDVAGDCVYLNRRWCQLTGRSVSAGQGQGWLDSVHPEDRGATWHAFAAATGDRHAFGLELRLRRPEGGWRWVQSEAAPRHADDGTFLGHIGSMFDIDERRNAEQQMRRFAMRDALTGLPNRRMLRELLARAHTDAGRNGGAVALLFVDLDEFKQANDTLGHQAGDRILVEAGRRLRAGVCGVGKVARLGGDEFGIVVDRTTDDPGELDVLAARLITVLGAPFRVGQTELRIGASIEIAAWPNGADEVDDLLIHADLALYAAKHAGRGTWRYFRPEMQVLAQELLSLDRDLRRALERAEFRLHFQPIICLADQTCHSYEALVHWQHPRRGLLSPAAFLPAAERSRLIVPLTFWVLAEAMRQLAAWRADGLGDACVAVNLSAAALEAEGLVEHVLARLQGEGLPATALLIEVTEGVLDEAGPAIAVLEALRGAGVRVAIDDFGAGYSSLARLRDLPLDLLKIDRALHRRHRAQGRDRVAGDHRAGPGPRPADRRRRCRDCRAAATAAPDRRHLRARIP